MLILILGGDGMKKLIILLMLITGILHSAQILKTGQIQSYDVDGNPDCSIKDDGYYQAGLSRSYSRSEAGVVTDHTTGLEWQDDYSDNGNAIKEADWQGAIEYCSELTLDGEDWRLPSKEELVSLSDYGRFNSAIDPLFTNVTSGYYWSSTTYAGDSGNAWNASFYNGNQYSYGKTSSIYVLCVRVGQIDPSTFERDDEKKIVTDSTTELQWQDDTLGNVMNWTAAIEHCEELELGDHSDWRLPNKNELTSIVDDTQYNPSIYSIFENVASSYYWSSTTYASHSGTAWCAYFGSGYQNGHGKTDSHYVRCVRSGQFDHSPLISTDFTSNNSNDLLWHDSQTGAVKIMEMNGMIPESNITVMESSNPNLIPKGIGDFTGDSKEDILFHNQNSGNLRIWEMDGTGRIDNIQVLGSSNANLYIAGLGDFDGDGDNDIATFNTNSGTLRIWIMDGTTRVDNVSVFEGANLNLVPRGAGDMDGDGIADIVLRNNNSGAVRVWTMNSNLTRKGNLYVTGSSNTNLKLRGVVDINGDGNADILNYNTVTGKLRAWLMNGNFCIKENAEIVQDLDLDWSVRN